MRAAVTTEDGGFEVVDLPDPAPGPEELVVSVVGCGVCGSDLKARPFIEPGMVMGHEFGGTVVAVGARAAVGGWREGDVVAVLPVVSCGQCRWCDSGAVAHCESTRFIGMGADSGGFAELTVVPAVHSFAMPVDLPASHAALVEPFAVGLHAMRTAEVKVGEHVLVLGAGGVGLTTVAWASALGAGRVTVVDPDNSRRALALRIGADDALDSVDKVEPTAYDAVVECVGRPELIAAGAGAVGPRGRIVVAGACELPVTVEPIAALLSELSLRWSLAYGPDDFRTVIEAFAAGRVDPSSVVGATVGLEELAGAFDAVRSASTSGRVLVKPAASSSHSVDEA
jgi:(R,R)-butanediol dehydrogenase / meso-butanediol dehydrogenase / diacetyl reductase